MAYSIVHVLSSFGVGSHERVALDLAIGQKARGHQGTVLSLAPAPDGAMADEFREHGIIYGAPAARITGAAAIHTKHGVKPGSRGHRLLRRAAALLTYAFVALSDTTEQQARA